LRSPEEQWSIINKFAKKPEVPFSVAQSKGLVQEYLAAAKSTGKQIAAPGTSKHQKGNAIDFAPLSKASSLINPLLGSGLVAATKVIPESANNALHVEVGGTSKKIGDMMAAAQDQVQKETKNTNTSNKTNVNSVNTNQTSAGGTAAGAGGGMSAGAESSGSSANYPKDETAQKSVLINHMKQEIHSFKNSSNNISNNVSNGAVGVDVLVRKEVGPEEGVVLHIAELEDAILGISLIPLSAIQSSLPTLTGIRAEYLRGVTKERLVILDAKALLLDKKIIVHEEVEAFHG